MQPPFSITGFIAGFSHSPLGRQASAPPWALVADVESIVRRAILALPADEYTIREEVALHRSAVVESGAVVKGPVIVGPECFIAHGAYVRGGNWFDAACILGPAVEVKSSFLFAGTKVAHLTFIGDSLVGRDVNFEAGSVVCNHRNERPHSEVRTVVEGRLVTTGQRKFGALIGDGCRIGANAVIAPGAILAPGTIVARAALLDQDP